MTTVLVWLAERDPMGRPSQKLLDQEANEHGRVTEVGPANFLVFVGGQAQGTMRGVTWDEAKRRVWTQVDERTADHA
jgi:hypothetical protein